MSKKRAVPQSYVPSQEYLPHEEYLWTTLRAWSLRFHFFCLLE